MDGKSAESMADFTLEHRARADLDRWRSQGSANNEASSIDDDLCDDDREMEETWPDKSASSSAHGVEPSNLLMSETKFPPPQQYSRRLLKSFAIQETSPAAKWLAQPAEEDPWSVLNPRSNGPLSAWQITRYVEGRLENYDFSNLNVESRRIGSKFHQHMQPLATSLVTKSEMVEVSMDSALLQLNRGEMLIELLTRTDDLLLRLKQSIQHRNTECSVDEIVSDIQKLLIDYSSPPRYETIVEGVYQEAARYLVRDLNINRDQHRQDQQALGFGGSPFREVNEGNEDLLRVAVPISTEPPPHKVYRCPFYFSEDIRSRCKTKDRFVRDLIRHLRRHKFYYHTRCSRHFIGTNAKAQFERHVNHGQHNRVCIAIECQQRERLQRIHERVPGCPNPATMKSKSKWYSLFALVLPGVAPPDWIQVWVNSGLETDDVRRGERSETAENLSPDEGWFDLPGPSIPEQYDFAGEDLQDFNFEFQTDRSDELGLRSATDPDQTINALRQQVNTLQARLDRRDQDFSELVSQNEQQNLLLLDLQSQLMAFRNSVAGMINPSHHPDITSQIDRPGVVASTANLAIAGLAIPQLQPLASTRGGSVDTQHMADSRFYADATSSMESGASENRARDSGYGSLDGRLRSK